MPPPSATPDEGRRTLIVTTDPASNLADVFEQAIGHHVTPIAGVPNLWAMEIDPDAATAEYKDRALGPIRAAFPPAIVQVMEEQMSGPCTVRGRGLRPLHRLPHAGRRGAAAGGSFDVIIFDTAPTGHTIRLLELPAEWVRSIKLAEHGSGQTCIGPTAAIEGARIKYERALALLRDRGPVPTSSSSSSQKRSRSARRSVPSASWRSWASRRRA